MILMLTFDIGDVTFELLLWISGVFQYTENVGVQFFGTENSGENRFFSIHEKSILSTLS